MESPVDRLHGEIHKVIGGKRAVSPGVSMKVEFLREGFVKSFKSFKNFLGFIIKVFMK